MPAHCVHLPFGPIGEYAPVRPLKSRHTPTFLNVAEAAPPVAGLKLAEAVHLGVSYLPVASRKYNLLATNDTSPPDDPAELPVKVPHRGLRGSVEVTPRYHFPSGPWAPTASSGPPL
jgi:hypothetical protein